MHAGQVSASLLLSSYLGKEKEKIGQKITKSDFAGELQKFLPASGHNTSASTSTATGPSEPATPQQTQASATANTAANQSDSTVAASPDSSRNTDTSAASDSQPQTELGVPVDPKAAEVQQAPTAPVTPVQSSDARKTASSAEARIAKLKNRAKNVQELYVPNPMLAEAILTKLHYPAETIKACKSLQNGNGQISVKDFKALLDGTVPSGGSGTQEQIPAAQVNAMLGSLIAKGSGSGQASLIFPNGIPSGINIKTDGSYTADQVKELIDQVLQQPTSDTSQQGNTDTASDKAQITGQTVISPKVGQTQLLTASTLPPFLSDDSSNQAQEKGKSGDGTQNTSEASEQGMTVRAAETGSVEDKAGETLKKAEHQALSTADGKEVGTEQSAQPSDTGATADYTAPSILAGAAAQTATQPVAQPAAPSLEVATDPAAVITQETPAAANTSISGQGMTGSIRNQQVPAAGTVNRAAVTRAETDRPTTAVSTTTTTAQTSASTSGQISEETAATAETVASTAAGSDISGAGESAEKLASMVEELNARTIAANIDQTGTSGKTPQSSLREGSVLQNLTALAKETDKQSSEKIDASQFPGLQNDAVPFQESRIAMHHIETSMGQDQTAYDPNRMVELVQNYQEQARGANQLLLEMESQGLGKMSIKVQAKKEEVSAVVVTENESARQVLLKNSPELRQEFQDQGMVLGKFMVDVDGQKAGEGSNPDWQKPGEKSSGSRSVPKTESAVDKSRPARVYPRANNGQHSLNIFA